MGFDSKDYNNNGPRKNTTYLKISSEKEGDVVISKHFTATKKVNGSYEVEHLKNGKGYPLPFFGYLRDIKIDLENKYNNSVLPLIKFFFDDHSETDNYVLQLNFFNDKGRVNPNVFTLLNSLASITDYGYLKVYITAVDSKDKNGVVRKSFTVNVRNHTGYEHGKTNISEFLSPKDASLPDTTKVKWKYEYSHFPPIEIEETLKSGKKAMVNNVEEHKQFFIDFVNNEILPVVRKQTSVPTAAAPTTPATENKNTTIVDDDGLAGDDVAGDLPF